jgi:prefoldin subunit 5
MRTRKEEISLRIKEIDREMDKLRQEEYDLENELDELEAQEFHQSSPETLFRISDSVQKDSFNFGEILKDKWKD